MQTEEPKTRLSGISTNHIPYQTSTSRLHSHSKYPTSREVVDSLLLRNAPLTRMGLFEHYWPETIQRWITEGYPLDENGHPRCPAEVFGLDLYPARGWVALDPFFDKSEVLAETEEWQKIRNGAGAIIRIWKGKSGTPQHLSFELDGPEKWESLYKPALMEWNEKRILKEPTVEELTRLQSLGKWRFFGIHFIWEQMRTCLGDVCMLESLLTEKDWIHDFNRTYTDMYKRYYTWIFKHLGKPEGIWIHEDLAYKCGLFCSPATLEEMIFPYYREIISFFESHDLPVLFHSDGKIHRIVDALADMGFRSLNPMDTKADCDVVEIARRHHHHLAFIGGMNVRIFESQDRSLIRNEIKRITSTMRELRARYIFGSDHSIPPTVSYSEYVYACECFRDHCEY